ncbi:histone H1-like isoform X13 [Trematomus bernacchii]|uniref:histone H1-like isoform X13 n=1 Tax=Trematomus bernacchii TaxID=40690 RepID=UPI00146BD14F|nr:histone H1-like isoform X13 [Trematomus bernacchii]
MDLKALETKWRTALSSILDELTGEEFRKLLFNLEKIPQGLKEGRVRGEMPSFIIQYYSTELSITLIDRLMRNLPRLDAAVQQPLRGMKDELKKLREKSKGAATTNEKKPAAGTKAAADSGAATKKKPAAAATSKQTDSGAATEKKKPAAGAATTNEKKPAAGTKAAADSGAATKKKPAAGAATTNEKKPAAATTIQKTDPGAATKKKKPAAATTSKQTKGSGAVTEKKKPAAVAKS